MSAPRPWPVVLLTALGAWLAAVPLVLALFMTMGRLLTDGGGALVVGLLILAAAASLLRMAGPALFLEQLAVPLLLVGALSLGYGLYHHLPDAAAAALMLLAVLLLAALLPQAWLRSLLGAAAAGLALMALAPLLPDPWTGVALLLLAWAAARLLPPAMREAQAPVETAGAGWLLGCLLALCLLSGTSFLVGGLLPGGGWGRGEAVARLPHLLSLGLALAGAGHAWRAWPLLRRPPLLLVALVLAALAALMPGLGGALFALALCAGTARWRLAVAAALAAAWVIGAFYYRLDWPLAQKAAWLAGAGALLLLPALRLGAQPGVQVDAPPAPRRAAALWLGGGLLLTLAVANGAIWQKQRLIAEGRPVFVALAPVDPRSLMQGDFMRLRFAVPAALDETSGFDARPVVVARVDERGVATLLRVQPADGPAMAAGELPIELSPKDGRWVLVSDAWFFAEGEAARFERARFGEFRVLPDGRALLVGLADADLKPLGGSSR